MAVLYVLISHIGAGLLPFPHDAIGKVGVWIFFSLSAFLLMSRLAARVEADGWRTATGQYIIGRVFRIYPLFVIVVLLHWMEGAFGAESAFRHLLLAEGWRELWAIPVEFQYYLIIPLLAVLPRAIATALICVLAASALGYGVLNSHAVFENSIAVGPKLLPFLLASLLALWMTRQATTPWVGWGSVCLLAAGTIAYRHIHVMNHGFEIAPWLSFALGLAAVGIIAAVQTPGTLARLLSVRPLVFLGEISFSIYLLHMFVLGFGQQLGLSGPVLAWSVAIASVALAYLSYRLIEMPGIAAGRWLAQASFHKRLCDVNS